MKQPTMQTSLNRHILVLYVYALYTFFILTFTLANKGTTGKSSVKFYLSCS